MARKKYKQKYKSKREDFRKGGRVKAAVGGTQELKNITNYTPMPKQPVKKKPLPRKPIQQEPQKPVQPGSLTTGGLGRDRILPTGPAKTPVNTGRPIQHGRVGGITAQPEGKLKQVDLNKITPNLNNLNSNKLLTEKELKALNASKPISKAQEELNIAQQKALQTQSNQEKRALELAQAGQQPARPSPRMEREAMNPATGKQYTPEEKRALDASIDQREFKRSPTTGKGSDQMFIGREGDVQPQAAQPTSRGSGLRGAINTITNMAQTTQAAQAQGPGGLWWRDAGYDSPREAIDDGWTYDSNSRTWSPGGSTTTGGTTTGGTTTGGDTTTGGTTTTTTEAPITGTPEQIEEERRKRGVQAGRTAEQIAAGEIPEGMVPSAEAVKIMERRPDETQEQYEARMASMEAEAVQIEPGTTLEAEPVAAVPSEVVTTIQAKTGKAPEEIETALVTAAKITENPEVQAAIGELSPESIAKLEEIRELSGPAVAAEISEKVANAAKAEDINGVLSSGAFVPEVTAVNVQVSETPDAEAQTREAITGEPASGEAAQIIDKVGYEAAKQRAVKGTAAKGAAANMIAETAELPPDIAAAVVQDPATVEAQIDTEPVEVQAAVAALPTEALVSSQIETLLGGMEDGEVPMWAKPAVDKVNAMLAQRGMSVSTVGRDALFNSIIQSALPIAQSNATALQTRAAQNLSNEQQANIEQSRQDMQRRMANLSNRQTAESQTAKFAQDMAVMQSQFDQQAVLTTAEQQQQTRMANLQNQQQAAIVNVENEQQMNMQNLGNEQQVNMAELQIEAQVEGANQSAENQRRILEMQTAADFLAKNAGFKQQMELANLTNEQQTRLANLSALNQASSENLNAAQQTELANLNKTMQTNLLQANIAKDMGLAQLNVDQQRAIQNANTVANMDMANFNADQQRVMADSKFMQTVTLSNFNAEQQAIMQNATAMASLDLATADQRTKLAITNAQNFLKMDMANLSNEQQANILKAQQEQQRLLSNQSAENVANNINADSENKTNQFMAGLAANMEQFNVAQMNTAQTFNAQSKNAAAARDADRVADVNKANAAILNDITKFNGQLDFNRNTWNAANEQAIINSNISWRRDANRIDTATENAINSQNVQNAFGLTSSALSFIWNELADQATKDFTAGENAATRKLQAMIAAASSEGDAAKHWSTNFNNASSTIDKIFG